MRFRVEETFSDGKIRVMEVEMSGSDAELKALHALRPLVAPSLPAGQPTPEPQPRLLPPSPLQLAHYEPIQEATLITPPVVPRLVPPIEPPQPALIAPPGRAISQAESWKSAIAIGLTVGVLALSAKTGYQFVSNAINSPKSEAARVKPSAKPLGKPTPNPQSIPKDALELPQ